MNSRAKNLIFWVVVGLFMILLFNLFSIPGQSPDEDIKFSDFISKVERGEITLWATCQHPFLVRAEIAALFERPLSSVRVIVPYLGGGFGSKSYTKMEPIAVALARKARRPVRIQNAVGESMVTSRRHGMKARVRTAATSDGRLLGRDRKSVV